MKLLLPIIILSALILTGCDPYYNISVSNSTRDTVVVQLKPNDRFRTAHQKLGDTRDGFHIYKISPQSEIQCGYAIGNIDNDLPFKEIKIISKKDTVRAGSIREIVALFDKDKAGKLNIPYNITIRSKRKNKQAFLGL